MARIPPSLSYLTIYNSALRPIESVPEDEDAEEQAQILFHTSKERAISRDRMLRQVGLAKALVNFSQMFNSDDPCQNVHSQTRRMVMVFPEPDFCIHAGVELAKTLKVPAPSSKSKGKEKNIVKGKDKEPVNPTYDYSDASVNDQALQADILRGYEQFKLTHGSLTSILSTLGQQALELQLERFFTVWAWSWNIEGGLEFSQHLGTPLHPMHRSISPLLDTLSNDIPDAIIPIVVTSTHAMPSARFIEASLPASLPRHLQTFVPPPSESIPPSPTTPTLQDGTIRPKRPPDTTNDLNTNDDTTGSSFMGMGIPNLDVGKWGWLTFGKNGKKPAGMTAKEQRDEKPDQEDGAKIETTRPTSAEGVACASTHVDQSALDEAMSSEGVTPMVKPEIEKAYFTTKELDNTVVVSGIIIEPDGTQSNSTSSAISSKSRSRSPSPPPSPPREFMTTTIHLAETSNPLYTKRQKIYYLTRHPFLVALIGLDEANLDPAVSLDSLSSKVDQVLDRITSVLDEEALKSSTDTIPSLSKILQPRDRHMFALERAPFAIHDDSQLFASNSIHLYNAQALIRSQHGIQEVFSRGQSPQHWHVARNVAQVSSDKEGAVNGEVYMEVFRKEASLTDVDNVVAGVIRRIQEDVM